MSLVEFASLTKDVSFFLLINAKSHHILPLNYFSDPFPFFLWATFYAYACIIPRDQSDLHVLILPLLSTLFSIHQRHSFAMCCFSLALKLFCESLTYRTKYLSTKNCWHGLQNSSVWILCYLFSHNFSFSFSDETVVLKLSHLLLHIHVFNIHDLFNKLYSSFMQLLFLSSIISMLFLRSDC